MSHMSWRANLKLDALHRQTAGYGSGTRQDMTLSEFLDLWNGDDKGSSSQLYLKDWHFVNEFPNYQVVYSYACFPVEPSYPKESLKAGQCN